MGLGEGGDWGAARFCGVWAPEGAGGSGGGGPAERVEQALAAGCDFAVAPLVGCAAAGAAQRAAGRIGGETGPAPWPDTLLPGATWGSRVVGSLVLPRGARDRRDAWRWGLREQLGWAQHLGVQAVVLPSLENLCRAAEEHAGTSPRAFASLTDYTEVAANLASIVMDVVDHPQNHLKVWLPVPLLAPSDDNRCAWKSWHKFRLMCDSHPNVGILLCVPPNTVLQDCAQRGRLGPALERWAAEPVVASHLTSCIGPDHTDTLRVCMNLIEQGVQLILSPDRDVGRQPGGSELAEAQRVSLTQQQSVLARIFHSMPKQSSQEALEAEYRDYLQAPLQPLQDNLESSTYETFERDRAKYDTYEAAVALALQDRAAAAGAAGRKQVVMVVGAGRGPLVRASVQASQKTGVHIQVYALDKNPHAVVAIEHMILDNGWQGLVTLVHEDMREWQPPEKADILVSELLGSFGDNELSPECLDGAVGLLRPDGVSIPQMYTSFLAPISTTKLYSNIRAYKDREHFETPYVVKAHKFCALAVNQPVFKFEHGPKNSESPPDNTRSKTLTFARSPDSPAAYLHGFIGYFECILYKDVLLSTRPESHTPNMFSWFPIFFPLQHPVTVEEGEEIKLRMWRKATRAKVWYEYCVLGPAATHIHNLRGRSYAALL